MPITAPLTRNGKVIGSTVLAITGALISILFFLGVLPWATRAEVQREVSLVTKTMDAGFDRIERQLNEIQRELRR